MLATARPSCTAHEIVDDGVDGAVEVAETVRDQREGESDFIAHTDLRVSVYNDNNYN